jgi:hypothetical protein
MPSDPIMILVIWMVQRRVCEWSGHTVSRVIGCYSALWKALHKAEERNSPRLGDTPGAGLTWPPSRRWSSASQGRLDVEESPRDSASIMRSVASLDPSLGDHNKQYPRDPL